MRPRGWLFLAGLVFDTGGDLFPPRVVIGTRGWLFQSGLGLVIDTLELAIPTAPGY